MIDVRNDNEWNDGHIPPRSTSRSAIWPNASPKSRDDKTVVVQCQGGGRSSIAASLLQKMGRKNVANLTGGYQGLGGRMKKILARLSDRPRDRADRLRRGGVLRLSRVRPMIDNASNYLDKAREVARLGDDITNKSAFVPPAER